MLDAGAESWRGAPAQETPRTAPAAAAPAGPGASARPAAEPAPRGLWRLALRGVGLTLFVIGLVGIVLPFWPTTVLWIFAVLAFGRADPAFAERIRAWPQIGPIVADFVDHGVLAPIGKAGALCALGAWALAAPFALAPGVALYAVLAVVLGLGVYFATRPSRRPGAPAPDAEIIAAARRALRRAGLRAGRKLRGATAMARAWPLAPMPFWL